MPEIGTRIKKKREELGMTQEELANKLGYKSKTTIAKIENGTNDIVQSKVIEFATALSTTTAYLMGWESAAELNEFKEKRRNSMISWNKSFFASKLANSFDELDTINKKKVIGYAEKLLDIQRLEAVAAHAVTGASVEDIKHDDDIMDDEDF